MEHDLFISYTHLDNERYDSDQGWIDLFHERLAIRLAQLLGEKPRIWRDRKLRGNDDFAETLMIELSKAALLVSVMSPRYLKSEWCSRELHGFYQNLITSGVTNIDGKARIFKVLKTPVDLREQPEAMQKLLGYEFYEVDSATGKPSEFSHHKNGPNYDNRYWSKLNDLAWEIKQLIEQINPRIANAGSTPSSGKTIYLAETTSDRTDDRDVIKRQLLQRGHRVLPDRALALTQQLRGEVNASLAESRLSVHLIGSNYGVIPEGESKSIVEIQQELATGRAGADFTQIVWMANNLTASDERQQRFIDFLLNRSDFGKGSELLQTKLEDLKTLIDEKLNPTKLMPEHKSETGSNGNQPKVVYLACDQPDYDAIAPIEDCLYQRGFEVLSLGGETDPQMHKQFLLDCDAALIYCGNAADSWLNLKKMDLIKLAGYGRAKPMLAKAFFLSTPETKGKERFRIQDGLVLRNYGDFSPALLDPFINEIERAKGTRS